MALSVGSILCPDEPGVPFSDEGGREQMCFLREMRRSLQNGCGCDKNTQSWGVHPLRDVRSCLSYRCGFASRYGFGDGKEAANETTKEAVNETTKKTTKKTNMEESK